jgi:hypothetical protein
MASSSPDSSLGTQPGLEGLPLKALYPGQLGGALDGEAEFFTAAADTAG